MRKSSVTNEQNTVSRSSKIFGSYEFVMEMIGKVGDRYYAKHVVARAVMDGAYSTHGHKLAAKDAKTTAA